LSLVYLGVASYEEFFIFHSAHREPELHVIYLL